VDFRCIGEHQLIQFAKAVRNFSAVEIDTEFAFLHVDARHDAEIAVVDVLVIIVFDRMTFSPGPKVQPKRATRISPGDFRAFRSSILGE